MTPGLMIGFLAGLSAGAIVGILFAPKKGEDTRRELRAKAMEARDRIQAQKEKLRRTARRAAESSKDALEQTKEAAEESLPR